VHPSLPGLVGSSSHHSALVRTTRAHQDGFSAQFGVPQQFHRNDELVEIDMQHHLLHPSSITDPPGSSSGAPRRRDDRLAPTWWHGRVSKHSAGILLFKVVDRTPLVMLVHPGGPFWRNKDAGAWTIPKGECSDSEELQTTALREFAEETGTHLPDPELVPLGQVKQKGGKVVTAWAVEGDFDPSQLRSSEFELEWPPKSGQLRRFPEVDRAQWYDFAEAREKMNSAQHAFVQRLEEVLRERGRID
jgi:predicted NUDIX family NTP pyrophosphohydrolase